MSLNYTDIPFGKHDFVLKLFRLFLKSIHLKYPFIHSKSFTWKCQRQVTESYYIKC